MTAAFSVMFVTLGVLWSVLKYQKYRVRALRRRKEELELQAVMRREIAELEATLNRNVQNCSYTVERENNLIVIKFLEPGNNNKIITSLQVTDEGAARFVSAIVEKMTA